jgi:hypothetical protein
MVKTDYSVDIYGSKISLKFLLDKYSEKKYRLDCREFVKYQLKKLNEEKPELSFYRRFEKTEIPYSEFLELATGFLSKVVFSVLKENRDLITSEKLEIKIRILRVAKLAWYGACYEGSNPGSIFMEFSALWLLQTIVYPWKHSKKIDYQIIYKFLVHELQHHRDAVAKLFRFERRYKKRIGKIIGEDSGYPLEFIYAVLFELRYEGLADFAARAGSPKFEIHNDWIIRFKKNLKKLAAIKNMNKASDFFDEKLSTGTPTGSYYCGMVMCLIINAALAKKAGKPPFLQKRNGASEHINNIDSLMKKEKSFYILNSGTEFFEKARSEIEKTKFDTFLKLYNDSCDELGISQKSRIMWWQLFRDIRKKAVETYRKGELSEIKKRGYIPEKLAA